MCVYVTVALCVSDLWLRRPYPLTKRACTALIKAPSHPQNASPVLPSRQWVRATSFLMADMSRFRTRCLLS